jgi:hypothetical protein
MLPQLCPAAAVMPTAGMLPFREGAAGEPEGGDGDHGEGEEGLDFGGHGGSEAERGPDLVHQ